jgi:peptidoglycan L-alanyl-D-glutamate endopeptidase CwlK
MQLTQSSIGHLVGVHPRLTALVERVAAQTPVDFVVVQGVRTLAAEREAVATGHSETMNSLHLVRKDGFGHAIDFAVLGANGQINWGAIPQYTMIGSLFKTLGVQLATEVVWGGDWHSFKDWGHIELDRKFFPI